VARIGGSQAPLPAEAETAAKNVSKSKYPLRMSSGGECKGWGGCGCGSVGGGVAMLKRVGGSIEAINGRFFDWAYLGNQKGYARN
jgi:hypothetical protein